jgi:hypothetical protein
MYFLPDTAYSIFGGGHGVSIRIGVKYNGTHVGSPHVVRGWQTVPYFSICGALNPPKMSQWKELFTWKGWQKVVFSVSGGIMQWWKRCYSVAEGARTINSFTSCHFILLTLVVEGGGIKVCPLIDRTRQSIFTKYLAAENRLGRCDFYWTSGRLAYMWSFRTLRRWRS